MHIKSIAVQNIKGLTGHLTFGPATMIIGDNFAGKSALLSALTLGVFGYLPHPRKDKMVMPFDLCSADEMRIGLECSDGRMLERHWTKNPRGSIRYVSIPESLELAPPILIDAKAYFDLSANKRTQFVFDCVKLDGADPSELIAGIANIKLDPHTPAAEKALNTVLAFWRGRPFVPPTTVQEWITGAIEAASEQQLTAKQTFDRMAKTITGLTELQAKNPEDFDSELVQINSSLANYRLEMNRLQADRGRIASEMSQFRERASKREKAKQFAEALPRGQAQLEKEKATLAEMEATLALPQEDRSKKLASHVAVWESNKAVLEGLIKDVDTLKDELQNLHHARLAAASKSQNLRQQLQALADNRDAALKDDCCQTCRRPWDNEAGRREQITIRYNAAVEPLSSELAVSDDEAIRLEGVIKEKDARLVELKATLGDALTATANEQEQVDRLKASIQLQKDSTAKLASDIAITKEQIKTTEANIARCQEHAQYLIDNPEETNAELIQEDADVCARITKLDGEIKDLEQKQRASIADKATLVRQMQALEERDAAQAEVEIWKAALKKMAEFQRSMVDGAFGTLMATANRFVVGILDAPLEYDDGDIGRRRKGRWVPIDQFSGTEHAIAYAGMCVALAAKADFKLVMVDELTRIRGARKAALAQRMIKLVEEGIIHQFVGVDVCTDDGQVPSYYANNPQLHIIHLR